MISFGLGEEQESLRRTVRKFAEVEIRPALREAETEGAVPAAILERAHELGLALLEYPEGVGGLGLDMKARVLVEEELAAGDVGIARGLGGPGPAGYALLEMGSESQQREWLAGFRTDAARHGALAVTESRAGFRPSQTATTAVRAAGGFRLNGRKSFVDNGEGADPCVVLARLEDEGLGLFAVGAGLAGRRVARVIETLGLNAVRSVEIDLEDCFVPASARLSTGDFARGMGRTLARTRVVTAAQAVGLARAAFEYAAGYAVERRTFGKPIAEHQGVAFLIAEMGMEVDAARGLVWRAAWTIDAGGAEPARHAAAALAQAIEAATFVTDNAVQVLGGHGYMRDHPVEKWFRDAKMLALAWGSLASLNRRVSAPAGESGP